jgi:ketosteroid isomerase-like protein
MSHEVEVVRRLFAAVEGRDFERLLACYADDVEIHEAEVLPYGGIYRGREGAEAHAAALVSAWDALQGPEEIPLEPRFCGNDAGTVYVQFRQRGADPASGARFDAPVVSVYQIRDQLIVRSQMFHADSDAVVRYLRDVGHADQSAEVAQP